MIDGSIGEGVQNVVGRFAEITGNIKMLEPVVRDELLKMPDKTLWDTVCHSVIADTLEDVPEGTHLFQCAWANREIFNERNNPHHYLISKDPGVPMRRSEPKPEIMVNIARMARFSMACPFSEMERCPRRNFRFATSEERGKRENMLVRETGRMRTPDEHGYRQNIDGAVFTGEDSIAK